MKADEGLMGDKTKLLEGDLDVRRVGASTRIARPTTGLDYTMNPRQRLPFIITFRHRMALCDEMRNERNGYTPSTDVGTASTARRAFETPSTCSTPVCVWGKQLRSRSDPRLGDVYEVVEVC